MKKRIQFYLIVVFVIVMFDAVASAVSRTLIFDYTKMAWFSYMLYVAAGYLGCKSFDIAGGILAGLIAGLADSTIGWLLSSVIGPFIPFAQPRYTPLLISVVIITVSIGGALLGLVGALLFKIINKGSPSS